MKELYSVIEIDAPANKVWAILTDFSSYPDWNPFIRKIKGEIEEGQKIEAFLQPPGSKGMSFSPRILKVEPNREFRWLGRLILPKLFDGEHIFELKELENSKTLFVQREKFRGLLAPMIMKSLGDKTQKGFDEMNKALKERAES
ncbi:SRPBCC family protein [Acidobacteriota bacterium]